jgi:hypothetical protein
MMTKPMINIKQETFHVLDYNMLEDLIQQHTGIVYESCAENEWSNDSCAEINIHEKDWDEYKELGYGEWLNDHLHHNLWAITALLVLARANKIPYGSYLIRISW